jgi:hypothetical protein
MQIPMGGPPSSFGGELGNGTPKLAVVPCLCIIKTSGVLEGCSVMVKDLKFI